MLNSPELFPGSSRAVDTYEETRYRLDIMHSHVNAGASVPSSQLDEYRAALKLHNRIRAMTSSLAMGVGTSLILATQRIENIAVDVTAATLGAGLVVTGLILINSVRQDAQTFNELVKLSLKKSAANPHQPPHLL